MPAAPSPASRWPCFTAARRGYRSASSLGKLQLTSTRVCRRFYLMYARPLSRGRGRASGVMRSSEDVCELRPAAASASIGPPPDTRSRAPASTLSFTLRSLTPVSITHHTCLSLTTQHSLVTKMAELATQLYGNATELVHQFIASTKPLSYDLYANTDTTQLNVFEVSVTSEIECEHTRPVSAGLLFYCVLCMLIVRDFGLFRRCGCSGTSTGVTPFSPQESWPL